MSSLVIRCVFYRPEYKANGRPLKWNFEVLGMQRWDKPTDRAQRVDEKMGLKCLKRVKIMALLHFCTPFFIDDSSWKSMA